MCSPFGRWTGLLVAVTVLLVSTQVVQGAISVASRFRSLAAQLCTFTRFCRSASFRLGTTLHVSSAHRLTWTDRRNSLSNFCDVLCCRLVGTASASEISPTCGKCGDGAMATNATKMTCNFKVIFLTVCKIAIAESLQVFPSREMRL